MIFCFDDRRRMRNVASAMRAAPATAETAPTTMSVEVDPDRCSGEVDTGPGVGATAPGRDGEVAVAGMRV